MDARQADNSNSLFLKKAPAVQELFGVFREGELSNGISPHIYHTQIKQLDNHEPCIQVAFDKSENDDTQN